MNVIKITSHSAGSGQFVTRMFDSLDEIAQAGQASSGYRCDDVKWAGGTLSEALRKTREGDLAGVAASEALLAKFESLSFPTYRREWYNEVAGHVANVPAFLAGHPQAMRRRRRAENSAAPITVFVDLFASCAFTQEQITTRGAAVLALVRLLAMHRPVTLYAAFATTSYSGRRSHNGRTTACVAVKLDTAPLDLAHAAYVLTSPLFLRQVLFHVCEQTAPGTDPFPPLDGALCDVAEEMLGAGTQILAMPGVVSDVVRDPGKWIEERIREAAPEVLGETA